MDSKHGSGRIIAGLIVIALGAIFLLDSLNVLNIDIGEIIGWVASIAFIGFGIGTLIVKRFRRVFFPIVLIVVGLFLLLSNLNVDVYQYWPVILIVVGVAIIFGGSRRRSRKREHKVSGGSTTTHTNTTTTSEGSVAISCTLGEANERVDSSDFTGGTVNVTLGNANLDLRDASIVNRPATLDVSLTMAGLNIRVPSEWGVAIETDVTMGESEDKRSRMGPTSDPSHLIITGNVTMGSFAIDD
ncbi:MAG: DUF5668 domain-containing protein [Chloroflexi bacterium]|nr:DUF5668 domain-containing protein [Chloroflexota bacterium]